MSDSSSFAHLPNELVNKILSYLDLKDVHRARFLNRQLYSVSTTESFRDKEWLVIGSYSYDRLDKPTRLHDGLMKKYGRYLVDQLPVLQSTAIVGTDGSGDGHDCSPLMNRFRNALDLNAAATDGGDDSPVATEDNSDSSAEQVAVLPVRNVRFECTRFPLPGEMSREESLFWQRFGAGLKRIVFHVCDVENEALQMLVASAPAMTSLEFDWGGMRKKPGKEHDWTNTFQKIESLKLKWCKQLFLAKMPRLRTFHIDSVSDIGLKKMEDFLALNNSIIDLHVSDTCQMFCYPSTPKAPEVERIVSVPGLALVRLSIHSGNWTAAEFLDVRRALAKQATTLRELVLSDLSGDTDNYDTRRLHDDLKPNVDALLAALTHMQALKHVTFVVRVNPDRDNCVSRLREQIDMYSTKFKISIVEKLENCFPAILSTV